MALALLVSFQEQKQKQSVDNAFAMLMLFKSKRQYFARRHSLTTWVDKRIDITLKALLYLRFICFKSKSGFQRGNKRIFHCVARRHSLKRSHLRSKEFYLFQL